MSEYIINSRGAKIYADISKYDQLFLKEGRSLVLYVLSVGNSFYKGEINFYITTESKDGTLQVFVLPKTYHDWVKSVIKLNSAVTVFPSQVEFGLHKGVYTADMI